MRDESRAQERHEVKDLQSYIPIFVAYHIQIAARSTSTDTKAVFCARLYSRFIDINQPPKKGHSKKESRLQFSRRQF